MTPGIHVYLDRRIRAWNTSKAVQHAAKARESRVKVVYLLAEGLDGYVSPVSALKLAAEVYRDAGVQVGVYSLHSVKAALSYGYAMHRLFIAADAARASIVQLDAEESWKRKPVELSRAVSALKTHCADTKRTASVSVYGVPSWHPSFPWDEIAGAGYCVWQCYETAAHRTRVRSHLDTIRGLWPETIPAVASYKRKADPHGEGFDGARRLMADALRVLLPDQAKPTEADCKGLAIWADPALDPAERETLVAISERFGW